MNYPIQVSELIELFEKNVSWSDFDGKENYAKDRQGASLMNAQKMIFKLLGGTTTMEFFQ